MRLIIVLNFFVFTCLGSLSSQGYQLLIPKHDVISVVQDDQEVLYYLDKSGILYRHNSKLETRIEDVPIFSHLISVEDDIYAVSDANIWKRDKDDHWKIYLTWNNGVIEKIFAGNKPGSLLAITSDTYFKINNNLIDGCADSRNLGVITADKRVVAKQIGKNWYVLDQGIVRKVCNNSQTIITEKYIVDLTEMDGKLCLISENDGPFVLDGSQVAPVRIPNVVSFPYAIYGRFYKDYYLSITPFDIKRYNVNAYEVNSTPINQEFTPKFQDSKGRIFGYDQLGVGYISTVSSKSSPKFSFKEMTIDDKSVLHMSSYELINQTARMRIEAESVDWYSANPTKYFYRLPPKYAKWEEWNITSLLLLDLDENTQLLELKSVFEGKESNLLEGPFPIRVKPKESYAVWYLLLGSLTLLAIGGFIANTRLKRLRRAHRERISRITLQKQYAEEQLKSLQLQMNPHFLFNVLNSIQGLIALGEHKLARQNLNRFAQLMRGTLYQSTDDHVTIDSELSILDQYLQLEQLCRPDKFDYEIVISREIDRESKIPSMLIQPFVENSILHGIRWKETKGTINLTISPHQNGILCQVTDDGVGRNLANEKKDTTHKSVGLNIVKSRLKKYFRFQPQLKPIEYQDLVDSNGKSIGTDVKVILPIL